MNYPDRPVPAPPTDEPEQEPMPGEAEALAGALSDIPMQAAVRAHSGTSFVPEQRGEQIKREYVATLRADYRAMARYADTPEKLATLAAGFAEYRAGYSGKVRAWLGARASCVSTMIAGRSGFNVRRAEKKNRSADKRAEEMSGYRERLLSALEKELRPELRPIMSGDADATSRLRGKIAKLEELQERMKAANAAIRKEKKRGPAAQMAALVALGFKPGQAEELLKPDFCGRIGFAHYQLQNNGAEIRRAKARLEAVGATQAQESTEAEGEHARLEDCPAENRVRLWFPGKPVPEVRDALKGSGFRWAPSLGCWQAYRNWRSLQAARVHAGLPAAS